MISDALRESIKEACLEVSVAPREIHLEFPENAAHGDYSTNVALMYAKGVGSAPRELAERIVESLQRKNIPDVERIKAAGAGFINFYLSDAFFARNLTEVVDKGENYGRGRVLEGERVMVEYTDPNPFKEFHIGHLMSNTIGESLARIVEWNGAVVVRACYQGDVGLHVAKTLWVAIGKRWPSEESPLAEKMKFLGEAYAAGSRAYEEDEKAREEVQKINKKIFERSPEIMGEYQKGRTWSLEHFEQIYKRLGTKFDVFFFESEVWQKGVGMVKEGLGERVFEESEGAVIFRGEPPGLHTRVFVTAAGLPTYEAKELGLNVKKFEVYPDLDESIIVTAN
ncbi:MAG: arginine--tRNA ligase [Candidatus Taylorbacteria bacterium]|nr:arginine--tRNA ligase [Candidatus Taylorbacteria bacterium]